ncbi:MAG: rRNA maturation RNase YbeY [Desulfovibrionaceae bacterium]
MIAVQGPARPRWGLAEGRRGLARLTGALADHLGLGGRDVGLRLVDDAEMAEINLAYRGLPGPTNVLSFPESEAEAAEAEPWLGAGEGDLPGSPGGLPFAPDEGPAPGFAPAEGGALLDSEAPDRLPALGDIILDLDAVAREARLYGQPVRAHLVRLLAHALLHLAGWDHGPDMEARTEAAVAALGEETVVAALGEEAVVAALGQEAAVAALGQEAAVAALGDDDAAAGTTPAGE